MLVMAEIKYIKHLREKENKSIQLEFDSDRSKSACGSP